jgi:hypothetical protein
VKQSIRYRAVLPNFTDEFTVGKKGRITFTGPSLNKFYMAKPEILIRWVESKGGKVERLTPVDEEASSALP